jgi:hypothetical protein
MKHFEKDELERLEKQEITYITGLTYEVMPIKKGKTTAVCIRYEDDGKLYGVVISPIVADSLGNEIHDAAISAMGASINLPDSIFGGMQALLGYPKVAEFDEN